jgi:hypothetical protein
MEFRDSLVYHDDRLLEKVGNNPHAWTMFTHDLLGAAEILENVPEKPHGAVARMLQGFAVECLLKAVWLAKGNLLVFNGKFKPIPGVKTQHDLHELARTVGVSITAEEFSVLKRLSVYITTVGRYPIPNNQGKPARVLWRYPTDDDTLRSLITKLRTLLKSRQTKGHA